MAACSSLWLCSTSNSLCRQQHVPSYSFARAAKLITPSKLSWTTTTTIKPSISSRKRGIAVSAVSVVSSSSSQTAANPELFRRKVYVGNIPRSVTNEELAGVFSEFGTVQKAEVMYDKYTQKSRRFAFVTMSTVEEAQAAVEKLNETEMGGRTIKVNISEKPLDLSGLKAQTEEPFIDSPHKVYVGNISRTVTTETLKKAFSEKGSILSAKVVRRAETGKSSGYGFVSFSSEAEVQEAISAFNNQELEGKKIRVSKA